MSTHAIDLTGRRSGRLLVLERVGTRRKYALWRCRCDCGAICEVKSGWLTPPLFRTKSCGCLSRERSTTHGDTIGRRIATEFRSWTHLIDRCTNPQDRAWKDYGGRGITVCARWRGSYEAFLADMGRKPSPKHSIDRIDNDGNYEPGNCRWATPSEQSSNQRPRRKHTRGPYRKTRERLALLAHGAR